MPACQRKVAAAPGTRANHGVAASKCALCHAKKHPASTVRACALPCVAGLALVKRRDLGLEDLDDDAVAAAAGLLLDGDGGDGGEAGVHHH